MNRLSTLLAGALAASALALAAPAYAAAANVPRTAPGTTRTLGAPPIPYMQSAVLHRPRPKPPAVTLVDDRGFRGGGEEGEEHEGFEGGHVFIGGGFGDPYWGGYGWGPYGGPGYYGPGYLYGYGYARPSSGLKLKIEGPNAKQEEVFANGNYVGTVSDFNGWFQELHLKPGQYHMEVRTPGYKPLDFNVLIPPGQTITYHGDLQPAQ